MFLRNKYFYVALISVIIQQIFVGSSTYVIGIAGENIVNNPAKSINLVIVFFILIGFAYVTGSISLIYRVKLSNYAWIRYVVENLSKIRNKMCFSTKNNKNNTNAWITTEAFSTINEAGFFFVDIVAIYLGIILNLLAMILVLGYKISLVIIVSLIISSTLLFFLKNKINFYANQIQNSKTNTVSKIITVWDNLFFGTLSNQNNALNKVEKESKNYFVFTEKYKLTEQIIATLPILIIIPILILTFYIEAISNPLMLGALIAILPRTLSLFQSIHQASMYSSNLVLMLKKLKNLKNYTATLDKIDYKTLVNQEGINIYDSESKLINRSTYCMIEFFKQLKVGRYTIKGGNGVGKSSLLKTIKEYMPHAIMLTPDILLDFNKELTRECSTGQTQLKHLHNILLDNQIPVILLDEWDANLDINNILLINNLIENISSKKLIIEVRHR